MNIPKGYRLVPAVATLEMKNAGGRECERQGIEPEDIEMQAIWTAMHLEAPAPPQPIYDEAAELEKFSSHWKLEGRIYRDKNTKQWLPTRDSIEGFQMAERVHALWLGWESCAKSVEVGHE